MIHDLLIRGGEIIDGTGAPRYVANLAVKDGRISYIGDEVVDAAESIDATGKQVTPGFIDTHTHYDAQIVWDPWIRPQSQHGFTTVICGNCGFTLAPVTDYSLKYLVPMLAKVEGIPLESLIEGAPINWRTTGEMLNQLEGKVGVNVGFMTGHSTLRANVMQDRSRTDEATRDDIEAMKALLRASLEQGSLGFSSSHIESHMDHEAIGVPSRHASRDELLELMSVVKDYEGTITGYVLTGRNPTDEDKQFMAEVSLASGRIYSWPLLTFGLVPHDVLVNKMSATDVARDMGAEFRVQAPSCPINNYTNLKSGLGFDQFPGRWNEVYRNDHAGRIAAFSDPDLRPVLEADALKIPRGDNSEFMAKWATYEVQSVKAEENKQYIGKLIGDIAKEQGKTPFNALMDIVVADNLETIILPTDHTADERTLWQQIVDCMRDNRTIWGGDDGGAHLDQLEAYSHGTRFIEKAVREYGMMPLEEAIHHFTEVPARFVGLKDRGTLTEGNYADIVILDETRVAPDRVEMRADFPAGGERLYTGAQGYDYVIVNGVPIIADGAYTMKTPGTVMRAREHTYTVDIKKGAAVTEDVLLAAE